MQIELDAHEIEFLKASRAYIAKEDMPGLGGCRAQNLVFLTEPLAGDPFYELTPLGLDVLNIVYRREIDARDDNS